MIKDNTEKQEEVMQAFYDLQQQLGLNNYETVVMIQKQLAGDKQAVDAETPTNFSGLMGKLRG